MKPGKHSPWMTWDDLINADPDFIIIMPCGFGIERTQQELHLLTGHPSWKSLKAVRSGNVYLTDGHQYFNRPGPRIVDSAENPRGDHPRSGHQLRPRRHRLGSLCMNSDVIDHCRYPGFVSTLVRRTFCQKQRSRLVNRG